MNTIIKHGNIWDSEAECILQIVNPTTYNNALFEKVSGLRNECKIHYAGCSSDFCIFKTISKIMDKDQLYVIQYVESLITSSVTADKLRQLYTAALSRKYKDIAIPYKFGGNLHASVWHDALKIFDSMFNDVDINVEFWNYEEYV